MTERLGRKVAATCRSLRRFGLMGLSLGVAAGLLSACETMPAAGPPTRAVMNGPKAEPGLNYYLIRVTPQIMAIISERRTQPLNKVFANGQPAPALPIGVGDTISVTIWENSGLFAAAQASGSHQGLGAESTANGANAVTLPNQVVAQTGDIGVPFAGRIPAAGLTPAQVEREIVAALKDRTISPQVLVTVAENNSTSVTVGGDVNHPGRIPLSITGTRLLDAIAIAGGASAQTSDVAVQLTRDGVTRRVRLDTLVKEPTENIYLRTGDLIYLVKEPQTAVILGATEKNEQVAFIKANMSLAEMVGNGGGLNDVRADPFGVFVFRYEPAAVVRSLGPETVEPDPSDLVPVVYQIDLKSPQGYFVAQAFPIRDHDLVYVANTDSVQLAKIGSLIHTFTSIFQKSAYVVPTQ
jgi:polysaccharide export outer membrane protein